ncbi:unnamed protein product, partial [Prorocentrum cordatum]
DSRVFPCLSASVNCRIEDMCTLHMSGEFCVEPPPGFLPAVSELSGVASDSGGTTLPVGPMASVQGNTESQRDGTRESISLLHLCALQGTPGVEVAEKLASKHGVPYIPLLDGMAEEFHVSMLLKPVWRDDEFSLPYPLALRSGASSAKHIDKLKAVHQKHMKEAKQKWKKRLGWVEEEEGKDESDIMKNVIAEAAALIAGS